MKKAFALMAVRIVGAKLTAPKLPDEAPMLRLVLEASAEGVTVAAVTELLGRSLRARFDEYQLEIPLRPIRPSNVGGPEGSQPKEERGDKGGEG